jgi:uncharacterized metal-binding protein
MNERIACQCASRPTLIFACSGGSDVGELSDRVTRRLTTSGVGKMYCLAGIGGRVNNILKNVEAADRLVVIDGCSTGCARQVMLAAGFGRFEYFDLSQMGHPKGRSPASEDRVAAASIAVEGSLICSTQPTGVSR